jgi:hypothetical protein
LSPQFARELLARAAPVDGVPGLVQVGEMGGLETPEALRFLVDLMRTIEPDLQRVLAQRSEDRTFIDTRVRAMVEYNRKLGIDFLDPEYRTILGLTDARVDEGIQAFAVPGVNHFRERAGFRSALLLSLGVDLT